MKTTEELRIHFAGLAMQGLLSNPEWMKVYEKEKYLMKKDIVAEVSLEMADELIKQLGIEQSKIYEIDFDGNALVKIKVQNNKIEILGCINGGGYPIEPNISETEK